MNTLVSPATYLKQKSTKKDSRKSWKGSAPLQNKHLLLEIGRVGKIIMWLWRKSSKSKTHRGRSLMKRWLSINSLWISINWRRRTNVSALSLYVHVSKINNKIKRRDHSPVNINHWSQEAATCKIITKMKKLHLKWTIHLNHKIMLNYGKQMSSTRA